MENQPTKHSAASIARNIGIGVVTPVLAAAIIYFLGFNNSDGAEFKKKKEATVKAWTAFIQNKGIFTSVFKQMDNITDAEVLRKNINHEIDITVDNMENIKKESNADQKVYSTIDITVEQIKEIKPIMNKFLDDVAALDASNATEVETKAVMADMQDGLFKQMQDLAKRDSIRLATYYEALNKEYEVILPKH